MPLFDGYVAVDWSASNKPEYNENSIWIAIRDLNGAIELCNPGTRREAINLIETLLSVATEEAAVLLCGFDFAFGYSKGTARMLTGECGWAAVWARVAQVIEDGPNNCNNRFEAAAELNEVFEGEGPFWVRHHTWHIEGLLATRPRRGWGANLPPERRYAEKMVPEAKTVWQLFYEGNVGGQVLTGIAALQRMRRRAGAQVWPFETLGDGRSHVLAEIYPSLISPCPMDDIDTKDERQVRAVAAALQELDRTGELRQYLRAPLDMPARVRREEGAILGMHDPEGFEAARLRVAPCC